MKNFIHFSLICFFVTAFFSQELSAQEYRRTSDDSFSVETASTQPKTIAVRNLKEGVNHLRLGDTKIEVIKSRGKLVSLKSISNTGKKGANMLTSKTDNSEFTCLGNICVCFGDDDCNNMFTSNVCSSKTEDAACVGDTCACKKD